MASRVLNTLKTTVCRQLLSYCLQNTFVNHQLLLSASYAKKVIGGPSVKSGKAGVVPQKKQLNPETDAEKLTKFLCGGNILKEGSDPELRPASEYPDWLWSLRLDRKPLELDEIEPDTWHYWKRIQKMNRKKERLILKNKYRYHKF